MQDSKTCPALRTKGHNQDAAQTVNVTSTKNESTILNNAGRMDSEHQPLPDEENNFGDTTSDGSSIEYNTPQISVSTSTETTARGVAQPKNCQYKSNERDAMIMTGIKSVVDYLNQKGQPSDDIQSFGNFIVSKLRTIQNANHRELTQRRLLNVLWEQLDQQPV